MSSKIAREIRINQNLDVATLTPGPMEPVLWDERRTTIEAHQILTQNQYHGKKRKNTVDAVAASLILEGYLAYRKNRKGNTDV